MLTSLPTCFITSQSKLSAVDIMLQKNFAATKQMGQSPSRLNLRPDSRPRSSHLPQLPQHILLRYKLCGNHIETSSLACTVSCEDNLLSCCVEANLTTTAARDTRLHAESKLLQDKAMAQKGAWSFGQMFQACSVRPDMIPSNN